MITMGYEAGTQQDTALGQDIARSQAGEFPDHASPVQGTDSRVQIGRIWPSLMSSDGALSL